MCMVGWQRTILVAIGLAAALTTADLETTRYPTSQQASIAEQPRQDVNENVFQSSEGNFDSNQRSKRQFDESAATNRISENEVNTMGITENDSQAEEDFNEIITPQIKRFFSYLKQRNRPKSESFKRGPGFRSWGGKRGNKFSSWGGKRSDEDAKEEDRGEDEFPMLFEQFQKKALYGGKRRPFQSWGGKRAYYNGQVYLRPMDLRKLLSWEGKRKFSSWGGKRSLMDMQEEKRKKPSFRSWGGKRSDEDYGDVVSTEY